MVSDAGMTRENERVELGFNDGIWSDVKRAGADREHAVITVIGAQGACVKVLETNDHFAIGSSISLRFQLPGVSDYVSCGCLVRSHVASYDIGVEFTLMSVTGRAQLAKAVTYCRLLAAA